MDTKWRSVYDDFIVNARIEGKTKATLEWYKYSIIPFVNFLGCKEIEISTVRLYLLQLQESKLSIVSVATKIRAIKSFLTFCHKEGYTTNNIGELIRKPKLPEQFPHVLNDYEVNNLIKACNQKTWEGLRNYTIVILILDTGIRSKEILGLELKDVTLEERKLIVHGKGGRDREIYTGRVLSKALWKWLKVRGHHFNDLVFVTRNGEELKKRHLNKIIKELGKKAGITKTRVSPHTLRHTFATNYVRNGGDVFSLQKILGHQSIKTCMIYVHMSGGVLKEAQLKYSPLDKIL